MEKQLLYKDLARYYDLIYSWKDYKKEAAQVKKIISTYKRSNGNMLLEVACGTGKHVQYLKVNFSVIATDINNGMLAVAKKNIKGVTFRRANMVTLNLKKQFDIVVCLFSSIGYVKTKANLRKTIRNFSYHLKKGGVVLIEPWLAKAEYEVGKPSMTIYNNQDVKIARLSVARVWGNVSIMDMNYLVAERNKEVKYFIDRHELAMFDTNEMIKIMRGSGLRASFLKNGLMEKRGILVGVKK